MDAANGHDVNGFNHQRKAVMKNREVLTLDEERIRFEAYTAYEQIIKRAY